MKPFIDCHSHFAWGIDDGLRDSREAKEALWTAKQQNTAIIVATPHVIPGRHDAADLQHFQQRINELKRLAEPMDIEIFSGSEWMLNHDYLKALQQQLFIPFASQHYLLVECDVRRPLPDTAELEATLYEITLQGYVPIIAHVERYFPKGISLKLISQWIDDGYVIQVNAGSFLGLHGPTIQKNAELLLKNGLLHIIASDTHQVKGRRMFNLLPTYQKLAKHYSTTTLDLVFHDNPQALISGQKPILPPAKKHWLHSIWERRTNSCPTNKP